ncbi:hypothetical protein C1H46_020710, partial [Malus baccata]
KQKVFVKSVLTKKQANMDRITGDEIPRSFVFSRCKLPGPLKQLQKFWLNAIDRACILL